MIRLQRNTERLHVQGQKHEIWHTFLPRHLGPFADGFGLLTTLDEIRIPPNGLFPPYEGGAAEIITYIYRGSLAQRDSTGRSGALQAGEVQYVAISRRIRFKEANASKTNWAHVIRVSLQPLADVLDAEHEQKRFGSAQRHNTLCVVASPDGRKGSLRIRQDAVVCCSVLDRGHHLVHELLPGRSVWLHVICGEVTLLDTLLAQGDGMGVTDEASVSFTAGKNAEVVLVDLGPVPEEKTA
jgi:redox-sensitive bicupin YhaK (pirin superfamily)